jgi:hypothetical protein
MSFLDPDAQSSLTDLAGLLTGEKAATRDDPASTPGKGETETGASAGDQGDADQPPEGEPAAAETEPSAEEPAGEEPEPEPSTEPVYTVRVDGKDTPVTLKEALAGYQRYADYTRKTTEVAEARKAVEAEVASIRNQREQYAAGLRAIQASLGPENQEPTAEQWNQLRQVDPVRYGTEWADYQRRQEQRLAVRAEQNRIGEEQRADLLAKVHTHLEGERQKLVAAIPVFADVAKAPAEMKALRDYAAKTFGYSEQEMDQAYDHRMIVAIDKARKWDAHMQALAAAKRKVSDAPSIPPPGSRAPSQGPKATARAAQLKQFERSGRVEDAVDLLLK